MSKVFFDTNILVYCLDRHNSRKQEIARAILRKAAAEATGVVSTQVLQEFYVVATRKLNVDPLAAKEMMLAFSNLGLVTVSAEIIATAIDCSILNRIPFWDGLIIAAAEKAACTTLLTEDLNDGQIIKGIRTVNPFAGTW